MLTQKFLLDMEKKQEEGMIEDLVVEFKTMFPKRCRILGDTHLVTVIKHCQKRASLYGYTHRDDLQRYILIAFFLGSRFDEDPLYPWAYEILKTNELFGIEVDKLLVKFEHYFDNTIQDDYAVYKKSLAYIISLDAIKLVEFKNYGQIIDMWEKIYPQKVRYIGKDNLISELQAQEQKLQIYGLQAPLGIFSYAGIMLFLGSYAEKDPLSLWVKHIFQKLQGDAHKKSSRLFYSMQKRAKKELYILTRENSNG